MQTFNLDFDDPLVQIRSNHSLRVPEMLRDPNFRASQLLIDPAKYEEVRSFYDDLRAIPPAALLGYYANPILGGELVPLEDPGNRFIGLFLPTREGKGVSLIIPNGFFYSHSMYFTDMRTETGQAIGYDRRHRMGQNIFIINPYDTTGTATRWNPNAEIRAKTLYEITDTLNVSTAEMDPEGGGFEGESGIWKKRARDLASGLKIHMLWCPDIIEKSNRSLINMVTLPGESAEESARQLRHRLEAIARYPHDPEMKYGFRDLHGNPTMTHPYVASTLQQQLDRPPNEGGSVISEMLTHYGIYRDPLMAANTAVSDVCVEDMMHGLLPATMFFQLSPRNFETAKPYTRLLLNLLINNNMRDVIPGQRPSMWDMLLTVDEFTAYGKLSILSKQLAYIAGARIRAFLIFQDISSQLFDTYGQYQQITANLHALIYGAMNEPKTAQFMSDALKNMTVCEYEFSMQQDDRGHGRKTTSQKTHGVPFLPPDAFTDHFAADEGILKLSGKHPIPIKRIPYFEETSEFKKRVTLWSESKQTADRIPRHLQVISQNRERLEREYLEFCQKHSEDLTFARAEKDFDAARASRDSAIERAVAAIKKDVA